MKTYVVGDIHGCYDEFIKLSKKIGINEEDFVLSLGDIVDRGNKSVEVYKYFKKRENSQVLMGNHERKHLKGILSYSQEIVKVQFGNEYEEFTQWCESLPYYYETQEAIIVHAFFEHDVLLKNQKEEVLAGTTSGSTYLEKKYKENTFWQNYYLGDKPIIYGHHVVGESPIIENNTYGIDTGACHGGKLTIVELPGFKIHQLQVKQDHWKEEQTKWQIPVLKAKKWESMKMDQIERKLKDLEYKEEPKITEYLNEVKIWVEKLKSTRLILKKKLEDLAKELKQKLGVEFYKEVRNLSYSSFIYKADSNNLKLEDLEKILDTPEKIIKLGTELSLLDVPNKKIS